MIFGVNVNLIIDMKKREANRIKFDLYIKKGMTLVKVTGNANVRRAFESSRDMIFKAVMDKALPYDIYVEDKDWAAFAASLHPDVFSQVMIYTDLYRSAQDPILRIRPLSKAPVPEVSGAGENKAD
ncbi:hypothetical protein EOM86_11635 [Candidatus Nomurabacteria bacterium]|nr:hypothetical protein [Candidatus Nomurabacteria bacterium]